MSDPPNHPAVKLLAKIAKIAIISGTIIYSARVLAGAFKGGKGDKVETEEEEEDEIDLAYALVYSILLPPPFSFLCVPRPRRRRGALRRGDAQRRTRQASVPPT